MGSIHEDAWDHHLVKSSRPCIRARSPKITIYTNTSQAWNSSHLYKQNSASNGVCWTFVEARWSVVEVWSTLVGGQRSQSMVNGQQVKVKWLELTSSPSSLSSLFSFLSFSFFFALFLTKVGQSLVKFESDHAGGSLSGNWLLIANPMREKKVEGILCSFSFISGPFGANYGHLWPWMV